MAAPISAISVPTPALASPGSIVAGAPPGGFESAFHEAIRTVEGARQAADTGVTQFLSGETEELHQTVLATQRAELAFELFLQVRNKVVQAYQEVMRMQM